MHNRRAFLTTGLIAASALALPRTGSSTTMAVPLKGIIYTAEAPGRWKGKEGSHAPLVTVEDLKVSVLTPHDMSAKHYIVRHTIISSSGETVAERTMYPDDAPQSDFTVPQPGKYFATSFCNLHDMWITEFTV